MAISELLCIVMRDALFGILVNLHAVLLIVTLIPQSQTRPILRYAYRGRNQHTGHRIIRLVFINHSFMLCFFRTHCRPANSTSHQPLISRFYG